MSLARRTGAAGEAVGRDPRLPARAPRPPAVKLTSAAGTSSLACSRSYGGWYYTLGLLTGISLRFGFGWVHGRSATWGYRKAAVVVRVVCAGMGRETLWQNYDSTAALLLRGAHALRGRDAW